MLEELNKRRNKFVRDYLSQQTAENMKKLTVISKQYENGLKPKVLQK